MRLDSPARPGLVLGLALVICTPACEPPAPAEASAPARDWPRGTVLAVDDVPILAAEIEALGADVRDLYPAYTETHVWRLALTNVCLPRAAVAARHAEARSRARAAAAAAAEEPGALGGPDDPRVVELAGRWRALGLGLWSAARHREPGVWSAPVELTGRFVLIRLDELDPGPGPGPEREELRLGLLEFPYLTAPDPVSAVERAVDGSRLTIVDAAWGEAVPEAWKHRMRGE